MILTRTELEVLLGELVDPIGLLVETNAPLPWPARGGLPLLTSVTFSGRTPDGLKAWTVPFDLAQPSVRGEVWEAVRRRTFYTWSAPETYAVVRRFCGGTPALLGDVVLASRMLHAPLPDATRDAVLMYQTAEALQQALGSQRAAYELEKQVAGWLMEMSIAGYQWADQLVHPRWTTIHESGSGRIVSKQPSLSNLKRADRAAFRAAPFKRWVEVAWPYADLTMVALLSGDPGLKALAASPDPLAGLAALWECNRHMAQRYWGAISTFGPAPARIAEALSEGVADVATVVERFVAAMPEWHAWLQRKTAEMPEVETWLGRRIRVTEARKVHGAVVMESVATAQKMLLAFLRNEAEFRAEAEMAGFATVIPVYDRVFYQIDVHVPVERHVALVSRLAALGPVGGTFHVEVSMGPSWGDLHRVDHDFGQTLADLVTPATVPVACPVCQRTAQDWPTLEAHLREAHAWTTDEVEGSR